MKVIIVNIEVKPEFREDFIKETEFAQHKTLEEMGSIEYQICQDENDQNKFVLFECYASDEAIEEHKNTAHFKQWRTNVWPWMAKDRTSVKYNAK